MSNVLHNDRDVFVLDEPTLVKLRQSALAHPLKRSRICLHNSLEDPVQEMVIVAHQSSVIEAHCHPSGKSESYHVIQGQLRVKIFDDGGDLRQTLLLDAERAPRMYRIRGKVWHQPVPVSEWVVYHEVYSGPFNKEQDVVYANWGIKT